MVVIDDGNDFWGIFESMYNSLCIKFHIVSKWNHKPVDVERFHKFLNHSQRISTEACGTSEPFVEVGIPTEYAWNASPIDGTDIIWSMPAIGSTICFPLDVNLAAMLDLIDNPSESVAYYICYRQRDVPFSQQLLAYLVKDHRLIHREQVNKKRHLVKYKPGNIVMTKVSV